MARVGIARGQPAAYSTAAVGFGIGFVLAGVLLLFGELGVPEARWPFVLPLILAIVGVLVLSSGLARIHGLRHPTVTGRFRDPVLPERIVVEPERWIPPSDR